MTIRVTDHRRWHRTKIACAGFLFLVTVACAGGLESANETTPMPSGVGFVTALFLLTWLTINIIKDGEW